MKILSIDTTTKVAAVSILNDNAIIEKSITIFSFWGGVWFIMN